MRESYQKALFLTDNQAALLKQNAANCNAALDQHHSAALPAIEAARATLSRIPPGGPIPPLPPATAALEQARTDISNGCISSLHAALGDRIFSNIDVFLGTKFARTVSPISLPHGQAGNGPPIRVGAAIGSSGRATGSVQGGVK